MIYNCAGRLLTVVPRAVTHLSKPRLCASSLQSQPRALGASRPAQIFCRMDAGNRKAYGPTWEEVGSITSWISVFSWKICPSPSTWRTQILQTEYGSADSWPAGGGVHQAGP